MSGQTILVIDDSPTILKLVELSLAKAGFRVFTAENGESGIELAQTCHPDAILVDYLLPDLKGDDVCRAFSSQVALAKVPVVVMSAKGEEIGECFSVLPNVMNIIPKPFSPEALFAVVVHTLQKSTGEVPQPPQSPSDPLIDLQSLWPENEEPQTLADVLSPAAALYGDVAVISIADVLILLQDRGYTGVLEVTRSRARLTFFLKNGRIDFASAQGVADEFLLGRFLVGSGYLSEEWLSQALEERKASESKEPLGAFLCNRGLLSPSDLRKAMTKQTMALVFESLRWGNGRFSFRPDLELTPLAQEAALGLPADSVILEGLRRVEDWRLIEQEIGDFDMRFVRNEDKLDGFGRGRLLREETLVVDLVNGKNTVRDIVRISKLGSYEVSQILFRFLRSKLIRRRVAPLAV